MSQVYRSEWTKGSKLTSLNELQKFVHAAETGDIDELSRMIVEINDSYSIRCLRDKVCISGSLFLP